MRIDLHTHSTASDGTDAPDALPVLARAAGLDVVALTDHDSTAGLAAAAAAAPPGLTVLPGIELSCEWTAPAGPDGLAEPDGEAGEAGGSISLHLLGYLIDPANPELQAECQRLRSGRVDRGHQIAERLAAAGLPIDWDRVRELAGDGSIGRPHLARVLVEAGVVPTVDAAFRDYLRTGSPYYVDKAELDVLAAIGLVRRSGGVPVFAHPLARRRGRVVDDAAIAAMAAAGLAGLEVDHPDHDEAERAHLRGLAADLGLLSTGSSDYHGSNKTVRLGANSTDPAVYEAILAAGPA
ncbi:MAG TPA: PHP domain-containing protein [Mycobacteriales bacterium]|nr:PHP domain-containing protein [Mycobacteriales bacterium]